MMAALNEAAELLRAKDRFVILSHRRPDGDTAGSSALLCRALRTLGKEAAILPNPELTPRFSALWNGLTCAEIPEDATFVSVDVSSPDMLLCGAEKLAGAIALCLDHHETNPGFAACNCIEPSFAAAGELVWELISLLGVTLDKAMAEALYVAVSSDTGGFRHANTNAHSFSAAAACCAAGLDIFPLNRALFTVKTPARMRLETLLGTNIRFFADGEIALCTLSQQDLQNSGAAEDDAADLSNFPRAIEGVELGILARELPDGSGKLSLRAGSGYNAAALCSRLGGGGHAAAAGASVPGGMQAACDAILRVLTESGVTL